MLPAMLPVQNAGPGQSVSLEGPQNVFDVELRMAEQARQKIQDRLQMAKLFQQYRAQLTSNKHDITVTSDPPSTGEKICLTVHENKKVVPLTVRNSGVEMVYLTLLASDFVKNTFSVRDGHRNTVKSLKKLPLGPGEAYTIKVQFYFEQAGFYEQLLVFKFKSRQQTSEKFEIMRLLEITQTAVSEEPLPTNSSCDLQLDLKYADSVNLNWFKAVVYLKDYPMPNDIKDLEKNDTDLEKIPLNWNNYCQRFQLLLHFEELQQKRNIEKFNQVVAMYRHSHTGLIIMKTAAVLQNSPSKLSGSLVLVTPLGRSGVFEMNIYKALVNHVDVVQIYLEFNEEFLSHFKNGMRFRVAFALNRMPLRTQHRATQLAYMNRLKDVLFPTGGFSSSHHSHVHRMIEHENNPEQCSAINHILAASAKPAPYLVFGPPGTGKTVTLVEAIKHIVKMQPWCNILICAPSNNATDHLCEKLLEGNIDRHTLFRLYALSFPVRKIPQNIKSCCNLNHKNMLMIPTKKQLKMYKIMATSLLTAGRLVTGGIPAGHYTYIFVDEAGQASETECIIPLAGLVKLNKCQVVLAGDPKQLGPVITSRVAERNGLGVSLLERLMNDNNLYKSHEIHGFNNIFVTKLLRNYRSHPAILKIPNELFYNGELESHANKATYSSYCNWEGLPNKDFPVIFHGVAGTDQRDHNSPSVYNLAEVEVLMDYLKALLDHLHKKGVTEIEPTEIGIITPYRKQVEKIQKALKTDKDLREKNLANVLVGSVEQFQGKEFNAILVSTVRSNLKMTDRKLQFTMGFVNDEKRFNVAMTRARALLIVIGDPRVLKTDKTWNKFIHYCFKEGGYCGIRDSDAEDEY